MGKIEIELGNVIGVIHPDAPSGAPWPRMTLQDAFQKWRSRFRSKRLPPVKGVLWIQYDEAAIVTYQRPNGTGHPLLFLFVRSPGTGGVYVYEKWLLKRINVP